MDIIRRRNSCHDTHLGKVTQHRKAKTKEGKIPTTLAIGSLIISQDIGYRLLDVIKTLSQQSFNERNPTMSHFIKLTLTDGDERIVNTNVILDIDEKNQSVCTSLTNEFVNGTLK